MPPVPLRGLVAYPAPWRIVLPGLAAAESTDAARNANAAKECVRGKFKDYYLQGQGGDPPADYKGRVFKLSQDYPATLPPAEDYPWLKIPFKDGGPVDPEAYLRALLAYGLEGNVDVDFYVEDNKTRNWYGIPWMDWNTEVANDWPGTDGREFVHGFTHEFDSFAGTLSEMQDVFVDTWSGAYFNDRAAFSLGQVYCNPDDPRPGMVNPDPTGLNNMAGRRLHHQAAVLDRLRAATPHRRQRARMGRQHLRQSRPCRPQQRAALQVRARDGQDQADPDRRVGPRHPQHHRLADGHLRL